MMEWNEVNEDMPRDGFILAFTWKVCGEPRRGFSTQPVFLRWTGKVWVSADDLRYGDSAIALWIKQKPPDGNGFAWRQSSNGYLGGLDGPPPIWKG
jgi:hypothetical protein